MRCKKVDITLNVQSRRTKVFSTMIPMPWNRAGDVSCWSTRISPYDGWMSDDQDSNTSQQIVACTQCACQVGWGLGRSVAIELARFVKFVPLAQGSIESKSSLSPQPETSSEHGSEKKIQKYCQGEYQVDTPLPDINPYKTSTKLTSINHIT